jgi:hypothetical protein
MNVIDIARQYIGKKELPGNSGFEDAEFESDMKMYGEWIKGYAWCACFAQMCFRKSDTQRAFDYKKLFDPSTRKTFENFRDAKYPILQIPVLGSLVVWGHYEKGVLTPLGHIGIVSRVLDKSTFMSIEGNTSGGGSRNGDRVYEHIRSATPKSDGLSVMGFIII